MNTNFLINTSSFKQFRRFRPAFRALHRQGNGKIALLKEKLKTHERGIQRFTRRKFSLRRRAHRKKTAGQSRQPYTVQEPKAHSKQEVQEQVNAILELINEEERLPKEEDDSKITYRFSDRGCLYEVNVFKEGAFPVHSFEDVKDRKELLEKTARYYLKNVHGINAHSTIDRLSAKLDEDLNQLPLSKPSHFDQATHMIAQYARDLQWLIEQEEHDFTMDKFTQLEKEMVLNRRRPVIINLFSLPDPKDEEKTRRFANIHSPIDPGGRTIPSTLRERRGLANYVLSSFGEVDADDQVSISFQAVRHGIFSPLQIPQKTHREAIAAQNVRQALVHAAKKTPREEGKGTSKEQPMKVEIRDVLLLSPLKGDIFRNRKKGISGKWQGYSETTQLKETVRALNLYKDRPIEIEIDGEKVWIQPDLSFLNLGANVWGALKLPLQQKPFTRLHYDITARGFCEFERDILNSLEGAEQALWTGRCRRQESVIEETKAAIRPHLDRIYNRLDQVYREALTNDAEVDKKEIRRLKRRADRLEAKLYKEFRKLEKIEKKEYRQVNRALESLLQEELPPKERVLLQNLIAAREIYHSGKTSDPKEVKTVQGLIIQSQSLMDRTVEFFCKSAEDRTGNIENEVLAREAYRLMAGGNPESPAEEHLMRETYYPLLHAYSASQNTARENANARGLQTTAGVNPYLDANQLETERKVATLAKKVPRIGKGLKPSWEVQAYFDR